ncbi:MAG: hypothetical protein IPP57_27040 [Candidatus Obscuribacter sp.]|nr:hypothetical protein [Candidatus Obscuribacter sp.]
MKHTISITLSLALSLLGSLTMAGNVFAQPSKTTPLLRQDKALASKLAKDSYPRLLKGKPGPDTDAAIKIARAAFASPEPHLYDAAYRLDAGRFGLVLAPRDWHGSSPTVKDGKYTWPQKTPDSDNLFFDPAFFAFKTSGGVHPSIYLQKGSQNGVHFAIRQFFAGPEEYYDLTLVNGTEALGPLFSQLESTKGIASSQVLCNHSWLSPWIYKSASTNQVFAITTGNQAKCLDNWQIYQIDSTGKATNIGTIGFMPEFAHTFDVIPKGPLKQMALVLDQMIGPASPDNGGFNPPARLKTRIRHMWANLLYRPQAMEQPPDTKAAINLAISKWSQESSSNFAQARKLNALYPAALKQLTEYYLSKQQLGAQEAKTLANKNLDLAFRTHFDL